MTLYRIRSVICIIFALTKISLAVQCNTNPCLLGAGYSSPNYQCLQIPDNFNDVICTCPDGQSTMNAPCRICETVNCGLNGVCIEQSFYESLFYACGCTNGTYKYINPGPCTNNNPTTQPPGTCFNGGIYNTATGTCICQAGFTGSLCEISPGQVNCQSVTCANGGVCNSVLTSVNGVDQQCTCLDGFSGPNCELVGVPGPCTSNLCQNGGTCEQKSNGATVYAFCRCPPGISGQCCQTSYFSCPAPGVFADPTNCKYGRYFQCVGLTLSTLSCPRGLRYNFMKMRCDSDVSCPP